MVTIQCILGFRVLNVDAILGSIDLKTVRAFFGFKNIIARAVFGFFLDGEKMRMLRFEYGHAFFDGGKMARILGIKLFDAIGIFLLGQLLVEQTKRLTTKPHATKAGCAATTVIEKPTIRASVGKNTGKTVVRVIAVRALDAALRRKAEATIDAVFAVEKPIGIQEGFRVVAAPAKITITGFEGKIAVVTVFAFLEIECLPGHGMKEIAILLEEGAIEIKRHAERFCIPTIAPPAAPVVDRKRGTFWVHGENPLFAYIALAVMKIALVAPHHFSLQATPVTER